MKDDILIQRARKHPKNGLLSSIVSYYQSHGSLTNYQRRLAIATLQRLENLAA